MASQKEYEMLFKLNAQLGGSYKQTFTKAQQELSRMAKEVETLKKVQSDISAYQKQQGAVEATRQKLSVLQQQYDNIQKEIQETGTFSSDLQNKLLSKQQQIDKTTEALNRQTDKLNQMDSSLREASVDTSNLTGESQRLQGEMDEIRGSMEEAADNSQDFGDSGVSAFGAIQTAIAAAGVAKALKEIADAYMECVNTAGNFEATMSTVEALSGANAEEMEQLADLAKELGASTVFTAQEAADAMTYMGMAGWKTADMLTGMDGVLQLAAASGEDLAMVSDIVTDNLTAFGLAASDTARFADVLAAAATNSNTNVSIMGETFKMSASVAGALGYSIEDVAIAVGLMANSGIKGSIAGTALKNTFNGLLEGVTLTGAAFGEYEYSAIQADGTMKDFSSTIDELRGVFNNMTEAERVNNAMTLAGQRGYNGLLAILNATDEDYQSLTNSINGCSGAAQKMASIKLDNMMGDLELMKSAWEGVTITVGEQFTPVMGDLYAMLAVLFDDLNKFLKRHPALIKAIAAFAAVIGTVVAAITAYAVAAKIAAAASALLSAAIPGVNIIMGVTAAVAAVTAGVVALVAAADDGVPSVKELTEAASELESAFAESEATYQETASSIGASASLAESYVERLKELESQGLTTAEAQDEYRLIVDKLNTILPDLNLTLDEQTGLLNGGTDALESQIDAWKRLALEQAMQTKYNDIMEQWAAAALEVKENELALEEAVSSGSIMQDQYNNLVEQYCALGQQIMDTYDDTTLSAQEQTLAIWELEDQQFALDEQIRELSGDMRTNEKLQDNLTDAIEEGSAVVSEYDEQVAEAQRTVDALAAADEELTSGQDEMNAIIGEAKAQIDALTEAYNDAYDAAYSSVSGQYALWETAAEVVATSAETINAALASQATYWTDYNTNLQSLGARSSDIEGLNEMIASFADGSADSVNAVAGMAAASDEDLATMVENWKAVQDAQTEVSGSLADVSVDLQDEMDGIVTAFSEDISALDMGEEAKANGRATIQGYIDAASSMLPAVQSAYRRLAAAANSALGGGISTRGLTGYATGTESAEQGFALVGEHGPELVYFNGGEQVMNAEETSALEKRLSEEYQMITFAPALMTALGGGNTVEAADGGYSAPIYVGVSFNIEGRADRETVEALEAYGDDFAERVIAVMEEAGVDTARRAYR